MLRTETVESATLDLLTRINNKSEFQSFRLVGGTALALMYGHRKSIDLDFFSTESFQTINFDLILRELGKVRPIGVSKTIKSYSINDIKVNFVQYPYDWLRGYQEIERLRIADIQDIAAMKIAAITNRGAKKDFYDLYLLLLTQFSLAKIVQLYREKYPDTTEFLALKSLTYFRDANNQEDPVSLKPITWEQVKEKIIEEYLKYMDEFG